MVDSMDIELVEENSPNEHSDEVVNAISGITEEAERELVNVSGIGMLPNVLVSTTSSNLFEDQHPLKTTRIIIHNPSSLDVLKNAQQTITFNPLNRSLSVPEKNTINFDPSVYDPVLPVRCRNVRGDLHKNRFGSGNRGRSILSNGIWYTPSEFESFCGREKSKDWKRSIRYGGRTLMCLIEQGVLRPHATSCTCSACCEDGVTFGDGTPDITNGPIRLFTPYKRRRKQNPRLKVTTSVPIASDGNLASAPAEFNSDAVALNGSPSNSAPTTLTVPLSIKESGAAASDSVIVTPDAKSQTTRSVSTSIDFSEQKQWWQLEEMVKNAVRQILDLQRQVEAVKAQCTVSKEAALQELRAHMETEKKEALSACRLEAQVAFSRAILEAKNEKEAAVQQALNQSRLEMEEKLNSLVAEKPEVAKHCANCDREAFSECTGCHRVSYCSAFCQRKDWLMHKDDCGENVLDADCSELIEECDDSTN